MTQEKTKDNEATAIAVKRSTRKRLFEIEVYGQTMDSLINEMIDVYKKHQNNK